MLTEITFSDWKEAYHWAIEQNISKPSLNLWQKLELAFQCPDYWELKAKAKKNQSCTETVQSTDKIDVLKVIADVVGCGRTTVAHFQNVKKFGNTKVLEACRKGDLSINAAYDQLFSKKKRKSIAKSAEQKEPKVAMVTEDCNIFDECEHGIDIGSKNCLIENGTPIDPQPIVEIIRTQKLSDGVIWVVFYRDQGVMQVVKKSHDKKKGIFRIKVNCYRCSKAFSLEKGMVIFEADHINASTGEFLRKDNSNFTDGKVLPEER